MASGNVLEADIQRMAIHTAISVGNTTGAFWGVLIAAVLGFAGIFFLVCKLKDLRPSDDGPRSRRNTPLRVGTQKTGLKYAVIGNGFLGSHIVEALLARGESDVVAFDIQKRSIFVGEPRVRSMVGDICNLEQVRRAVRGCHTVFHTAARISLVRSDVDYEVSHRTNCLGTDVVIEACKTEGVNILLHCSSAVVAKERGVDFTGPETAPYAKNPTTNYAKTKIIAEQSILAANGAGGLRTVALRFNSIWGPRDSYFITRTALAPKVLISVSAPHALRDWCYVENCVHAFLKCEETMLRACPSPADGRAFFIADGKPLTVPYFYSLTARAFNKYLLELPMSLIALAGYLTDLALFFSPLLTTGETCSTGLETMDEVTYSSGVEAQKAFGYEGLYSVENGINASVIFHENIAKEDGHALDCKAAIASSS